MENIFYVLENIQKNIIINLERLRQRDWERRREGRVGMRNREKDRISYIERQRNIMEEKYNVELYRRKGQNKILSEGLR